MDIIVSSEANVATPAAGYATLFINTDKGNILYAKYSDGTFHPYAGDSDGADIAKIWTEGVLCALKDGSITAAQFTTIMTDGFEVKTVTDPDTGDITTSVGTRP